MSPKNVKEAYDQMHAYFARARPKSERPGECTREVWQPCRLHPVDCPNCKNESSCQMKDTMRANPDKIKRCKHFDPKEGRRT